MAVTWTIDAEACREAARDRALEVLPAMGAAMSAVARSRAPVRTGALKESIGWEMDEHDSMPSVRVHAVYYDLFLEVPAKQMHRSWPTLRDALHSVPLVI